MEPKAVVLSVFRDLHENPRASLSEVERWISPDYRQNVDGKTMGFSEYVEHFKALQSAASSFKIDVLETVCDGNRVCTRHRVHLSKRDGSSALVGVIAVFEVENDQILRVDELTQLIEGSHEDKDLGSRT